MPVPDDVLYLDSPVNWGSDPFVITYEYKTEIFEVREGVEQRRALRTRPRKTLTFSADLVGSVMRSADYIVSYGQSKRLAFTEYTLSLPTIAPYVDGQPFSVGDAPEWLEPDLIVCVSNGLTKEIVTVRKWDFTSITLDGLVSKDWPIGTTITPVRVGRIASSLTFSRPVSKVASLKILLTETPGSEEPVHPLSQSLIPPRLYRRQEVLDRRPNWVSPVESTLIGSDDQVDYTVGVTSYFAFKDFNVRDVVATFIGKSRDDVAKLTDLFNRMKGARGVFYAPTWSQDFTLAETPDPNADSVLVEGTEVADLFELNRVYRNLVFIGYNDIYPAGIVSIVAEGSNSRITLDTIYPVPSTDTLNTVSWLLMYRFTSDILTVNWRSDSVADFNLSLRTVPDGFFDLSVGNRRIALGGSYLIIPPVTQKTYRYVFIGTRYLRIAGDYTAL